MKIAITWDYELFFGSESGSVERCMLSPTDELLEVAEKHKVPFTFFPDIGSLIKMGEYDFLKDEVNQVKSQMQRWDKAGHETGLHVHPHWEKSIFMEGAWKHDLNFYKLSDFSDSEIEQILSKYHSELKKIIGQELISFRAGGWCIQPFSRLRTHFLKLGLSIDSSVFKGGVNTNEPYAYDFQNAPSANLWSFEDHEMKEVSEGSFLEIPIASKVYHPLFFWRLFILGRLFPSRHKPIGNGKPAQGGGSKRQLLTQRNCFCISADGYFASELQGELNRCIKNKVQTLVVIGHPKALTRYSLETLDRFIEENKSSHDFVTLKQIRDSI